MLLRPITKKKQKNYSNTCNICNVPGIVYISRGQIILNFGSGHNIYVYAGGYYGRQE